jgi:hypothetical protein
MENIPITPGRTEFPVSFSQEAWLFMDEWARIHSFQLPASSFHVTVGFQVLGKLDIYALENALNEIVRRHLALQVAFLTAPSSSDRRKAVLNAAETGVVTGLYMQALRGVRRFSLGIEAVPNDGSREQEIARIIARESERPFDNERPPLLRGLLIRLADDEHLLVIVIHHLVADRWSLRLIEKELGILYASYATRQLCALPEPSLHFPDFAAWQKDGLRQTEACTLALAYWQNQWMLFHAGHISFADLPFALPAPRVHTMRTDMLRLVLDPSCSKRIRQFARQQAVTLYMLFFAAFAVLLQRFTGKSRLAIWANFANRIRPHTENAIGWFSNYNILGADLSTNPTGGELLQQVRRTTMQANAHQELPLAMMGPGARPFSDDVGEAFLNWLNITLDFASEADVRGLQNDTLGLVIRRTGIPAGHMRNQLRVDISDMSEGIGLSVLYTADRFTQQSMCMLLDQLHSITEKLQSSLGLPISQM